MLLELQLEAAAGGRFEGLLGAVVEVVAAQPATGRWQVGACRPNSSPLVVVSPPLFVPTLPFDQTTPDCLKGQLKAAAGGRFEGLLGGGVEVVVPQTATGRCKWVRARAHATHPWANEGVAAVHAGHAGCGRGWQRR
eukprot:scaffold77572_cov58-Phaeocystis_antarctica.AAC.2